MSPRPEDPPSPEALTAPQPPEPETDQDRGRFGRVMDVASTMVRSRLVRQSSKQFDQATTGHDVHLKGYYETPISPPHPLTGENHDPITGKAHSDVIVDFPRAPRAHHHHVELYERTNGGTEVEVERHHPLFKDIRNHIALDGTHKGKVEPFAGPRGAVRAYYTALNLINNATEARMTLPARFADKRLPQEARRAEHQLAVYREVNHAIYKEIMAVPHDPTEDGLSRTWDEELSLVNIQALRLRVMEKWAGDPKQARAQLEMGGLVAIAPLEFATYLGVDMSALRQQILKGGPTIVPPQVLNKINFFMDFAADGLSSSDPRKTITREGELPQSLRVFNDGLANYQPDNPDSPIGRMNEFNEKQREVHALVDAQLAKPGVVSLPTTAQMRRSRRPTAERPEHSERSERSKKSTSEKSRVERENPKLDEDEIYKLGIAYLAKGAGKKREDFTRMSELSFVKVLTAKGAEEDDARSMYADFQDRGYIAKVHTKGEGYRVLKSKSEFQAILEDITKE